MAQGAQNSRVNWRLTFSLKMSLEEEVLSQVQPLYRKCSGKLLTTPAHLAPCGNHQPGLAGYGYSGRRTPTMLNWRTTDGNGRYILLVIKTRINR